MLTEVLNSPVLSVADLNETPFVFEGLQNNGDAHALQNYHFIII